MPDYSPIEQALLDYKNGKISFEEALKILEENDLWQVYHSIDDTLSWIGARREDVFDLLAAYVAGHLGDIREEDVETARKLLTEDPDKLRRAGPLAVYRLLGAEGLSLFQDDPERVWTDVLRNITSLLEKPLELNIGEIFNAVPVPDSLVVEGHKLWSRPEWRTIPDGVREWVKIRPLYPLEKYAPEEAVIAKVAGDALGVVVTNRQSKTCYFYLFEPFTDTSRPADALFYVEAVEGSTSHKVATAVKAMAAGQPAGGFFDLKKSVIYPPPEDEVIEYAREHSDKFSPLPLDGVATSVVRGLSPEEVVLYVSVMGIDASVFGPYEGDGSPPPLLTIDAKDLADAKFGRRARQVKSGQLALAILHDDRYYTYPHVLEAGKTTVNLSRLFKWFGKPIPLTKRLMKILLPYPLVSRAFYV